MKVGLACERGPPSRCSSGSTFHTQRATSSEQCAVSRQCVPAVRALGRRSRAAASTVRPVLVVDGSIPYCCHDCAPQHGGSKRGPLRALLQALMRLLRPLRPPVRPALVGPRAWLAGRTETFSGASHLQSDVDTHGCALPCVLIGLLLPKCALKCITAVGFGLLQAAAEGDSRCTRTEFLLCPVLSVCTWLTAARSEASTKTPHGLTRSRAHTLTCPYAHTLSSVSHTQRPGGRLKHGLLEAGAASCHGSQLPVSRQTKAD